MALASHWSKQISLSLQAEEIGIECGAENVFFYESENGTKSIKVNLSILIVVDCTLSFSESMK